MVDAAKSIFVAASSRDLTWFFPQRMNNSVMLWATFNGIIGLILFTLSYQLFGKKHGVSSSSWGVEANLNYLIKTFALALLIFSIYYSFLFLIYYIFFPPRGAVHLDPRGPERYRASGRRARDRSPAS